VDARDRVAVPRRAGHPVDAIRAALDALARDRPDTVLAAVERREALIRAVACLEAD
jgi:hypothetical protein